ncbi:hypothetical protein FGO68_gene6404 [Halteria grandinella]|uniref:Uncharacterized protein n=1 Tax=Halteria grandinella TaxID=5974 RepID=A0A8J8NT43_HALGN|nr:hypothetical protein FGO68_gene6404 [Halteria grandinella]
MRSQKMHAASLFVTVFIFTAKAVASESECQQYCSQLTNPCIGFYNVESNCDKAASLCLQDCIGENQGPKFTNLLHQQPDSLARNIICSSDEYVNNNNQCAKVPDGCISWDNQDIWLCPDGKYCKNNQQWLCSAGEYQKSEASRYYCSDAASCKTVPAGCYQNLTGQITYYACDEGHYCPNVAQAPQKCPLGTYQTPLSKRYYCNEGSSCKSVPAGCYQNKEAQIDYNSCPDGHYCPSPSGSPIICPEGTYQTPLNKRYYCNEGSSCKSVPSGCYQNQPGETTYYACPEGHFCPTASGNPIICAAGTYQTPLSKRYYCNEGENCKSVPSGCYQNETGQANYYACPEGHYCDVASEAPKICPAGTYQTKLSSRYYCNEGESCKSVPYGCYQNESGRVDYYACPEGHYCAVASEAPKKCPAGTYQNPLSKRYYCSEGASCDPVPSGCYQTQEGTTTYYGCPEGYCCKDPSKPPALCPSGSTSYKSDYCSDHKTCYQPGYGDVGCPGHE